MAHSPRDPINLLPMTSYVLRSARCAAFLIINLVPLQLHSAELVMDRAVTLHSTREVAARRRALIQYLWGESGFPNHRLPDTIHTNVASPVKELQHLLRVDELRM